MDASAYDGVIGVLGAIHAVVELRAAREQLRRTIEVSRSPVRSRGSHRSVSAAAP
jgi:hypothetical protein